MNKEFTFQNLHEGICTRLFNSCSCEMEGEFLLMAQHMFYIMPKVPGYTRFNPWHPQWEGSST